MARTRKQHLQVLEPKTSHFSLLKSDGQGMVKAHVTSYATLGVHVEGYGDKCSKDSDGMPVVLAFSPSAGLCAYIWSDINREDPTHVINLEGARLDARRE